MSKAAKKSKTDENGEASRPKAASIKILRVQKSNIPLRLQDSAFFKSLSDNEDDEEIIVPSDCYREIDTVNSTADLAAELRVLRFWGLPITFEVFKFCERQLSKEPERINAVVQKLSRDWRELQVMLTIMAHAIPSYAVREAVRSGVVEFLDYLLTLNPKDYELRDEYAEMSIEHGHVKMLDYILTRTVGHPWAKTDFEALCLCSVEKEKPECLEVV